MKKEIETYIVDSFTDEAFKGNPAGVCIGADGLTDHTMLSIAQELGLSETAFLNPLDNPKSYSIRFFSPVMEIPLCGHATLASAKVLFERKANLEALVFTTIEEIELKVVKDDGMLKMEFPIYETTPALAPDKLLDALGLTRISNSVYNAETKILLLEISSSKILESLTPDFVALEDSHESINGVLVTAPSERDGYDFESRYFWPWSGTNEDPVTGGTHTFLAQYWSERLNKTKMNSFQCSARTGYMEVELIDESKLTIKSNAQIILQGKLII